MSSTFVQIGLPCLDFINIEDGFTVILLVKSHHQQLFGNDQFLDYFS